MKGRLHLSALVPPNVSTGRELALFLAGEVGAILYGVVRFSSHYRRASRELYQWAGNKLILKVGAKMEPFGSLMDGVLVGFALAVVALVGLVVWHYLSYRQGSMSVYLMRRLPRPHLMDLQCWAGPLLGAVVYGLSAGGLTALCHLYYWSHTPAVCLP